MTDRPPDVAAELWALADTVLTRLEPILRNAADSAPDKDRQGCSWCPVCALAALVRGEQHDLLTLVATEGAGVITLIRQLLAEHGAGAATPREHHTDAQSPDAGSAFVAPTAPEPSGSAGRPSAFVPITVTIRDSPSGDDADE